MAQFSFVLKKKFEGDFVGSPCPCWPLNLRIYITFGLKKSSMKILPCFKAHSIPYFQYKFQKTIAIIDSSSNVIKSPKKIILVEKKL
jgi:hypothetical protein